MDGCRAATPDFHPASFAFQPRPFPRSTPVRHSREGGNPESVNSLGRVDIILKLTVFAPSLLFSLRLRAFAPLRQIFPVMTAACAMSTRPSYPKPSPNRERQIPPSTPAIPALYPRHSRVLPPPVIPAKAGIQKSANNLAAGNQARIASDKSPFSPRHSRVLPPVIPAKAGIQKSANNLAAGNQARIASDKSLPPLWGKARMGVRRAQARLLQAGTPALPARPSSRGNNGAKIRNGGAKIANAAPNPPTPPSPPPLPPAPPR